MKYEFCHVRHDPEAGTHGDCVRACVASILNLDAADIPHFFHDGCDAPIANQRMREWAATLGLAPCFMVLSGSEDLSSLLEAWGTINPDVPTVLYVGTSAGEDHAVCILRGEIVHNPSWYAAKITGPVRSTGHWHLITFAKL